MDAFKVQLTKNEVRQFRELTTANAAVFICKKHFKRGRKVAFPPPPKGVDLSIRFSKTKTLDIEIKGTTSRGIARGQLCISGRPSYKRVRKGMPIYRVCDVFSSRPTIYVLRYPRDFSLSPEPRWRITRISMNGKPSRSAKPTE